MVLIVSLNNPKLSTLKIEKSLYFLKLDFFQKNKQKKKATKNRNIVTNKMFLEFIVTYVY